MERTPKKSVTPFACARAACQISVAKNSYCNFSRICEYVRIDRKHISDKGILDFDDSVSNAGCVIVVRMVANFGDARFDFAVIHKFVVVGCCGRCAYGEQSDYRRAVKALPGEKIVFSWVVWPDRKTGAAAHKGMWDDPRMKDMGKMPFDGKRMIMGGFEPILTYHKG